MSVTVRQTETVKAAIGEIDDSAWTPIEYTDAVYDENTGTWISRAKVAEIDFTAFTPRTKCQQIPGRLIVRRIPDLDLDATIRALFRHLAVPRVLHHHRPQHRDRRQNPPSARDHRTGPC